MNFNINADNQLIITSRINDGEPGLAIDRIGLYVLELTGGFVVELPFELILDEEGGGSAQIIWELPAELTSLDEIHVVVAMTDSDESPIYLSLYNGPVPLK